MTDRQTDGRTDRRTEFSSLDRVCIACSAVKMKLLEVEGARAPVPNSWRRHCCHDDNSARTIDTVLSSFVTVPVLPSTCYIIGDIQVQATSVRRRRAVMEVSVSSTGIRSSVTVTRRRSPDLRAIMVCHVILFFSFFTSDIYLAL